MSLGICINKKDFKIDEPTVVAIGKFDGEHIGHKKIFSVMREIASRENLKLAIFTFDTPPSLILGKDKSSGLISDSSDKRDNLIKLEGIDYIIEYPFDESTAHITGEAFVKDILIAKMNMKAIVAGDDCAFGYKKSGNIDLLRRMSKEYDFEVSIIGKVKDEGGTDISSTYIKSLLDVGDVRKVNKLLGRSYSIYGNVVKGNHIGSTTIGIPTINMFLEPEVHCPRFGVYKTLVHIDGDAGTYKGLTNIGTNPSIADDKFSHRIRIETYIYDYSGDLYGRGVRLEFVDFVREQIRFASIDELKRQINSDIAAIL